jgi:membrane associated rhomboid family serine protease
LNAGGNVEKRFLKIAVCSFIALFIVFAALGQVFNNYALTVAGLLCFTAAAALLTYYFVLTRS